MASASQQSQLQSTLPKEFPFNVLQGITENFKSEKLGESVFGTVYKGTLPNEGGFISVKKLAENAPVANGETFTTEVTNLMALQHENIVKLVGFCHETQKKLVEHNGRYVIVDVIESLLCYEYLENGSLDKHLAAGTIDWDKRFKIVKGICQGLHFLHKELLLGPLVHMNLVPNTVWLDGNWEPKIADFGLSRIFGQQQTRINTVNVRGHCGYIAPEYLYRGEISTQSDIYSLGVIIIEIATGEKTSADDADRAGRNFIDKVGRDWKTDNQILSKYPSLDAKRLQQVKMCIEIGLKCVDPERKNRPSIVDIIDKLEGRRVNDFRAPVLSMHEI